MVSGLIACKKKIDTPHELLPLNMSPTTWVLYMYKDNTTQNPISRNDTLIFFSKENYSYNNVKSTYALNHSQSAFNLSLQNTAFGNISGDIQNSSLEQGEILSAQFNLITPNGQTFYLWLKRIE